MQWLGAHVLYIADEGQVHACHPQPGCVPNVEVLHLQREEGEGSPLSRTKEVPHLQG